MANYKKLFNKAAEVYAEVANKVSLSERLWDEAVSEFWAYVAEVFGAAGFIICTGFCQRQARACLCI